MDEQQVVEFSDRRYVVGKHGELRVDAYTPQSSGGKQLIRRHPDVEASKTDYDADVEHVVPQV